MNMLLAIVVSSALTLSPASDLESTASRLQSELSEIGNSVQSAWLELVERELVTEELAEIEAPTSQDEAADTAVVIEDTEPVVTAEIAPEQEVAETTTPQVETESVEVSVTEIADVEEPATETVAVEEAVEVTVEDVQLDAIVEVEVVEVEEVATAVVESEVSDVEVCEVVVTETAELQTETLPRELQNLNANWNNLSDHTRATILMLMEADQLTQE